ncbi:hypothetical protein ATANTOWER_021129 [Ataeniobius toweri]|uniref:Uncharacterized protein n=1 Tax=Ataeniobius toweri TaxID=208326 RepID=A0ABU7ARX4_9TELE|nr:hypothetical protein [Ataeniobius toweri]
MSWRPQLWEAEAYSRAQASPPPSCLLRAAATAFLFAVGHKTKRPDQAATFATQCPLDRLHFCSSEWFTKERQIRMCLQSIILRGFTFKDLQSWIPRSSAELRPSSAPPPPSPFSFTPPPVSDPKGGRLI